MWILTYDKNVHGCVLTKKVISAKTKHVFVFNPLRPNSDLSQTSRCNMKGLSVRAVMRIESMISQVKFS